MRGLSAGVLLVTACASSSVEPDATPPSPDASTVDALVVVDAPLPDAAPPGPGTLFHDLVGDFTGTTTDAVVASWGGIEPVAYLTGGLRVRASDGGTFATASSATWAEVQAMTFTGRTAVALDLDHDWVAATPPGLGLSDGDTFTLAIDGEIWLEAGAWQFHLLADDHAFVDIAAPASTVYTRVASADWPTEATGGYTATVAGWHPIRIAVSEATGNSLWRLQATPPSSSRGALSRQRVRFAANQIAGLVELASDDSYLLGTRATTIDDVAPADVDWGSLAPTDLGLTDADGFAVRWAGQVRVEAGGDYTFRLVSDDGQRLWIDGQELLSSWDETTHDQVTSAIGLDPGWHDLVVDQMEIGGAARATLTVDTGPEGAGAALPVARLRPVVGRRERTDAGFDRTDRAIPDLGSASSTAAIDAPAGAKVDGVEVSWTFTHTYQGDLEIRLIAPDATSVLLRDNTGGSGSGQVTERMFVTSFDGASAAGTWTLRVDDTASLDSGTLLDFQLAVHHAGGTPPIPATSAYESEITDLGGVIAWDALTWGARPIAGSTIQLRARAGDSELAVAASPWSTPMVDPGGSVPPMPPARWFQYRIEMISDGDAAPSVDWVRLDYTTEGQ